MPIQRIDAQTLCWASMEPEGKYGNRSKSSSGGQRCRLPNATHALLCTQAIMGARGETISTALETAMHHPYDAHLIDRAARAQFAGAPTSLLARSCGVVVAKATVRDWRRDRRRAPKPVLKRLRELAQQRAAQCCEICRDLDNAIARRDGELIRRRGFMEIRERDGPGSKPRDGRNRLGRPKRNTDSRS